VIVTVTVTGRLVVTGGVTAAGPMDRRDFS